MPLDYRVDDYEFGKQLHAAGKSFDHCLTEEQKDGWQDAEADQREADGREFAEADSGLACHCQCLEEAEQNGEDVDWDAYWTLANELTARAHGKEGQNCGS